MAPKYRNSTALELAIAYARAGLSVIPIRLDGSKIPDLAEWTPYMERIADDAELTKWFGNGRYPGMVIVCGRASGHLETIDVDRGALFVEWCELVEAQAPGLIARLTIVETPRDPSGYHARYRCPAIEIPGNMKLAQEPGLDKDGKPIAKTLFETRGQGGQALAPGGNPKAHETGRPYRHFSGPALTDIQVITPEEREILLSSARSFDTWTASRASEAKPKPKAKPSGESTGTEKLRPGDDYERRGPDLLDIIAPHGWEVVHRRGDVLYVRRPGKDGKGWSATIGYCKGANGEPLLAVFSTNAHPFDGPTGDSPCSCYGKFRAYTLLNHNGDFTAAARALGQQGYGEQRKKSRARVRPGTVESPEADQDEGEKAKTDDDPEPPKTWTLGSVKLLPETGRRSASGKLTVPIVVLRGSQEVDRIPLPETASGRRTVAKQLLNYAGDAPPSIDAVMATLGEILVAARKALDGVQQDEGPSVWELVAEKVPEALRLVCRTPKGLWSEARGGEVTRADFLAFTPPWLLKCAGEGSDAPRDATGNALPVEVLKIVKTGLEVLWADLCERLPTLVGAELGTATLAGQDFRNRIRKIWQALCTGENIEGPSGEPVLLRASLIRKVKQKAQPYLTGGFHSGSRLKWEQVHPSMSAWWRLGVTKHGEPTVWLAMRWELSHHAGVDLPGVASQEDLHAIGEKFGVFNRDPGISGRLSGGAGRLAVLDHDFAMELLSDPEADASPGSEADASPEPGTATQ
jgi:hypothetical protein